MTCESTLAHPPHAAGSCSGLRLIELPARRLQPEDRIQDSPCQHPVVTRVEHVPAGPRQILGVVGGLLAPVLTRKPDQVEVWTPCCALTFNADTTLAVLRP